MSCLTTVVVFEYVGKKAASTRSILRKTILNNTPLVFFRFRDIVKNQ